MGMENLKVGGIGIGSDICLVLTLVDKGEVYVLVYLVAMDTGVKMGDTDGV